MEAGVGAEAPETMLCDTTFVSVVQSAGVPASWSQEVRDRLEAAVLAVSVFTLAELRAGHIYAKWGAERRARAEALIGSYLLVPLDMPTVDEWARLRAACKNSGITMPHNDLWIAATANVRGATVVSCDGHFDLVPDVDHLLLPRPST